MVSLFIGNIYRGRDPPIAMAGLSRDQRNHVDLYHHWDLLSIQRRSTKYSRGQFLENQFLSRY